MKKTSPARPRINAEELNLAEVEQFEKDLVLYAKAFSPLTSEEFDTVLSDLNKLMWRKVELNGHFNKPIQEVSGFFKATSCTLSGPPGTFADGVKLPLLSRKEFADLLYLFSYWRKMTGDQMLGQEEKLDSRISALHRKFSKIAQEHGIV